MGSKLDQTVQPHVRYAVEWLFWRQSNNLQRSFLTWRRRFGLAWLGPLPPGELWHGKLVKVQWTASENTRAETPVAAFRSADVSTAYSWFSRRFFDWCSNKSADRATWRLGAADRPLKPAAGPRKGATRRIEGDIFDSRGGLRASPQGNLPLRPDAARSRASRPGPQPPGRGSSQSGASGQGTHRRKRGSSAGGRGGQAS
ncbi:hypothetical protein OS493_036402 [Desmophyllum pertusum]|uniref:Uncharacterized protein n=1 Tax=Desmophyllum pertusum TaxID=174260 RepID=A0A9W9ZI68_9CNID|nr:hypothetical protein OS493_036402 [Desmophyllum pertusum]